MALTSLDPNSTAVISLDLQEGIVSVYTPNSQELVARAGLVVQEGRRAGMAIVHVKVGFRPGLPEIHPRNMLLGGIKTSPKHQQLFAGAAGEIHAMVAPEEGDYVVTKSRVNAFTGTDLELLLRAREIDTLDCSESPPAALFFRRRCTQLTRTIDCSSSRTAAPTWIRPCTRA